ncbi:MAG: bifunctional glutamate N-acetyltransferase/amino-acid acetyltransferase ArgJ [Bryobacterales bacterium]|nr:bifunctional glutamate N-acetyltransferase/amino-acid acetyltransferase ArgJ [Bryobacterales bacterium]
MILPLGYRYASTYAKIRKAAKDDLALIVSDTPASAAAVFTTNQVAAAPVLLARKNLAASKGRLRAFLINAGNANCATQTGMAVARETVAAAAAALGMPANQVLPASTGVIGVELKASLITKALPRLAKQISPDAFQKTAEAIMTTDLTPKTATAELAIRGGNVRIAGMTKGSGMIMPNMATTLGFLMCDAALPAPALKRMLVAATEESYHRLSVDGDTSTNDTVAIMANGASGVALKPGDYPLFQQALTKVMQDLASQIARDGEGAKKLVTIHVSGAATNADAARIARSIANSPLVKTAIAGSDPNWGRIICAAGYAGVPFDPSKADIAMQGMLVCKGGLAAPFRERELKKRLDEKDVHIEFALRGGRPGKAKFWTCDFTDGYIRINASYRT